MRANAKQAMIALVAVALLFVLGPGATTHATAQTANELAFAESDSLSVEFKRGQLDATKTVSVHNLGSAPATVEFCLLVEGATAASCSDSQVEISFAEDPGVINPGDVYAFHLTFSYAGDSDEINGLSGQLMVRTTPPATSAIRPITFTQPEPSWYGRFLDRFGDALFGTILLASLAIAAIWTFIIFASKPDGKIWLPPEVSGSALGFTGSFASSLTTLGAFFGTILSSSIMPEAPTILSQKQLVGLNVLFLALILVAPFIYNSMGNEEQVKKSDGSNAQDQLGYDLKVMRGTVPLFFASSFLTLWAVFGELMTLSVLVEEVFQQHYLPIIGITLLIVLILIIAILVFVYSHRQIGYIAAPPTAQATQPTGDIVADNAPLQTITVAPRRTFRAM